MYWKTLAFHLPVDDHARIITIVASQAPPPAKLMGGTRGDRFKMMSLFAGEYSAWEYDAIVADVVREIVPDHLPEVNAYYDHYSRNFSFLKKIRQQYFQQIFPFQPRCFEVVRNITKRELATIRSSIHYVYEVLERPHNLSRRGLIKVADLLDSPNLLNDLQTAVYHEVYQSYQSMLAALADLFDEAEELDSAITSSSTTLPRTEAPFSGSVPVKALIPRRSLPAFSGPRLKIPRQNRNGRSSSRPPSNRPAASRCCFRALRSTGHSG